MRNFCFVVLGANLLNAASFGYLTTGFIAYTMFQSGLSARVSEAVALSDAGPSVLFESLVQTIRFTGCAFIVTLLSALGLAWFGHEPGVLATLAVFLPVLGFHELSRAVAVSAGRPGVALASESAWFVCFCIVAGIVTVLGLEVSAVTLLASWAVGAVLPVLCTFRLLGFSLPNIREVWSSDHALPLGSRFFAEFFLVRGTSQLSLILLGVVAGFANTGALRGIGSLFGPLVVLMSAIPALVIPSLRAMTMNGRRFATFLLAGILVIGPLVLGGLLSVYPHWGERLLGDTWELASTLVAPITLQFGAMGLSVVALAVLRMTSPRSTLPIRWISALVQVVGFWVGYGVGGVGGAAWGLFTGALCQATLSWLVVYRPVALRTRY